MSQTNTKILLLGAGELGTSLLSHLLTLPSTITTLATLNPKNHIHLTQTTPSPTLLALDLTSPSSTLSTAFSEYDIIISATGFAPAPTSQNHVSKLANEVLEAGRIRKRRQAETGVAERGIWFFPWQWGVDYDRTVDAGGLMPLFGQQKGVRDLLRGEAGAAGVEWTVLSTGIFMSFLFERAWGVVERDYGGEGGKMVVRALNHWNHRITATHVPDIGKVLSRIILSPEKYVNRVLYMSGSTLTYGDLASSIEKVVAETGNAISIERQEWSVPYLEEELDKDPEDKIKRYRVVFAREEGVWWDEEVEGGLCEELGVKTIGVEEYARDVMFKNGI